MRKTSYFILLFTLGSCLAYPSVAQEFAKNRLTVKLQSGIEVQVRAQKNGTTLLGIESLDRLQRKFKCTTVDVLQKSTVRKNNKVPKPNLIFLEFEQVENLTTIQKAYESNEFVVYAEPDFIGHGGGKRSEEALPNDAQLSRQWGIKNDGSFSLSPAKAGADIKIESVWSQYQGDPTNIIAILDSGVKPDHPEYEGRIWQNTGETPNDGIDNDGNGLIDDYQGWNYADDNNRIDDNHGHGSNVTSIAAATGDNGIGFAGVDWKSTIMTCKVLDEENQGFYSWWIQGITYAVDNGASVINLSLGGSSFSQSLQDAVVYAKQNNVFVAVCMMNEDGEAPYYPAAYEETFAVGATDPDDTRSSPFFWSDASGSNFGSHINIVAPGNYIYGLSNQDTESYNFYWGGTSQATPYVAGVVSLVRVAFPELSINEIAKALENTADDQVGLASEDTPGFDIYYGHGRLNTEALFNSFNNVTSAEDFLPSQAEVDVLLYPNPAQNSIQISGLENKITSIANVVLYNIEGKRLATWELTPTTSAKPINLPPLAKGQYILNITSGYFQKKLSFQVN